jgi:hypothetical protein
MEIPIYLLTDIFVMASTLLHQGWLEEAVSLLEPLLEVTTRLLRGKDHDVLNVKGRKRVLGTEHPDTKSSVSQLARYRRLRECTRSWIHKFSNSSYSKRRQRW